MTFLSRSRFMRDLDPEVAAVFPEQANVLHGVFQCDSFYLRTDRVFQFQQPLKYGIIGH